MNNQIHTNICKIMQELSNTVTCLDAEQILQFKNKIINANTIFISGCGRSGFIMKYFAVRLMHLGLNVHIIGDATTPASNKGDLLLLGSGSGQTGSLISYASKAKILEINIGLITITKDSALGKMADATIEIPACTPKSAIKSKASSIQPMGTLFEQSMFIITDIIISLIMEDTHNTASDMFKLHANLE